MSCGKLKQQGLRKEGKLIKLTFKKKVYGLSPPGFEPGTFELEVQRANPLRHGDSCMISSKSGNRRMSCVDSLYGPFSHLLKLSTLNAFYLTLRQKCKNKCTIFPRSNFANKLI